MCEAFVFCVKAEVLEGTAMVLQALTVTRPPASMQYSLDNHVISYVVQCNLKEQVYPYGDMDCSTQIYIVVVHWGCPLICVHMACS